MNAIVMALVAAIPKAILAIASRLLTESFVEQIFIHIIEYGLDKLTANTKSPVTAQVAGDIKKQLNGGAN